MKIKTVSLMAVLLFISTTIFAISAEDKIIKAAKAKTASFVQVVNLDKDEEVQVYKILLTKEQQLSVARKKYKGDKEAFRAEMKPANRDYNRQIKDIIGGKRMKEMNEYNKAQRAANKK